MANASMELASAGMVSRWVDVPGEDEGRDDPGLTRYAYLAWERAEADTPGGYVEDDGWAHQYVLTLAGSPGWQAEAEEPGVVVNGLPLSDWLAGAREDDVLLSEWDECDAQADSTWMHGSVERRRADWETHGTSVRWGATVPVMRMSWHRWEFAWLDDPNNRVPSYLRVADVDWEHEVWSAGGTRAWDGRGRRSTHSCLRPFEADRIAQRRLLLLRGGRGLLDESAERERPPMRARPEKPRVACRFLRFTGHAIWVHFLKAELAA